MKVNMKLIAFFLFNYPFQSNTPPLGAGYLVCAPLRSLLSEHPPDVQQPSRQPPNAKEPTASIFFNKISFLYLSAIEDKDLKLSAFFPIPALLQNTFQSLNLRILWTVLPIVSFLHFHHFIFFQPCK